MFVPNFCKVEFMVYIVNFMVMFYFSVRARFCNSNTLNMGVYCVLRYEITVFHQWCSHFINQHNHVFNWWKEGVKLWGFLHEFCHFWHWPSACYVLSCFVVSTNMKSRLILLGQSWCFKQWDTSTQEKQWWYWMVLLILTGCPVYHEIH